MLRRVPVANGRSAEPAAQFPRSGERGSGGRRRPLARSTGPQRMGVNRLWMRDPMRRLSGRLSSQAVYSIWASTRPADVVGPTTGPAAMIECATHADDRFAGRTRGPIAGLTFGVGHRGFADRLAWHIPTPNRYVTKSQSWNATQARFLKRQLSLPVSTMSQ